MCLTIAVKTEIRIFLPFLSFYLISNCFSVGRPIIKFYYMLKPYLIFSSLFHYYSIVRILQIYSGADEESSSFFYLMSLDRVGS